MKVGSMKFQRKLTYCRFSSLQVVRDCVTLGILFLIFLFRYTQIKLSWVVVTSQHRIQKIPLSLSYSV